MKYLQSGRSMVEIIGTLAIIGVLSVTTALGIEYLLDKSTANKIMKDAHLGYMSTPITSCVNDFVPVEFTPESGLQTDYYCDRKNERYIRVSGISDAVCNRLLDMRSDNEVELYTYDEYTDPLCNKGDNALIFAFADTGFPALPCESIADCPPDFFGICHETDKMCLKCPEGQMPNTARNQCVDLQCDEETQTMCDNGEAKWCCPNTEFCDSIAGKCIKSDGMCMVIFAEPKVTKTYDCAYTFNEPKVTKTYDCAYTFNEPKVTKTYDCAYTFNEPKVTKTYDCAYKLVNTTRSDGTETIDLKEVKPCSNPSYYCNLNYTDEGCTTNAPANIKGQVLYGACSPLEEKYTSCTMSVDVSSTLSVVKPCSNPSYYCNLNYTDEGCATNAPANIKGQVLYGACSPLEEKYASCAMSVDVSSTLSVLKPCSNPSYYCNLNYTDEGCTTNAPANIKGQVLYGACSPLEEKYASCAMSVDVSSTLSVLKPCSNPSYYCNLNYTDEGCTTNAPANIKGQVLYGACSPLEEKYTSCSMSVDAKSSLTEIKSCPPAQYCSLRYKDENCSQAEASFQGTLYGICIEPNSSNIVCPIPKNN